MAGRILEVTLRYAGDCMCGVSFARGGRCIDLGSVNCSVVAAAVST